MFWVKPVRPFVVQMCSVPPEHWNEPATALQHARQPNFYNAEKLATLVKRLSQSSAFQSPRNQARHRQTNGGSKAPSRISNDLYPDGHVARRTDLQAIALCPDLPVRHSFRTRALTLTSTQAYDFGEPKLEALPYPQAMDFCDLVPSPSGFTPKRFSAFHG